MVADHTYGQNTIKVTLVIASVGYKTGIIKADKQAGYHAAFICLPVSPLALHNY